MERRTLLELRAALTAGVSPSTAVATAGTADASLEGVARALRLGSALGDAVHEALPSDPAGALLIRALAVAEAAGAGASAAVDQALEAVRGEAALRRLVAVRTAQARGTARILAAIPVAAWVMLVGLDRAALRLYLTPVGVASAVAAVGMAAGSWVIMRRLVQRAEGAAERADPLAGGATAETVELVAVAFAAGMTPLPAMACVGAVGPPDARPLLDAAVTRLRAGDPLDGVLAGTPLESLGHTVAAAERWGAPAAPTLRDLAADVRDDRRTAAEEAAERLQLQLVFPTTLLTLPAFVLAVVPPLLWATLGR